MLMARGSPLGQVLMFPAGASGLKTSGSVRPLRMAVADGSGAWTPIAAPSAGSVHRGGDRTRDRRALLASLLVHGAVITALAVSVSFRSPPKPETRTENTMTVSLKPGDGNEVSIPKSSAPETETVEKPVETPVEVKPVTEPKPVDKPVEKPVEPQSQQQASASTPSDTTSPARTMGGGAMIWTPPVPRPNSSLLGSQSAQRVEKRIEMPKVELPKGASDPVLLSYDQGRFTDATAMSEASRLMNTGTITMAVSVDEKGVVTSVVVTSTSGSHMLDERASLLIKSYTYRPAQDVSGKVHAAIVTEVLEWARDGKFASPADASRSGVRDAERAMPKTAPMPLVRMPSHR